MPPVNNHESNSSTSTLDTAAFTRIGLAHKTKGQKNIHCRHTLANGELPTGFLARFGNCLLYLKWIKLFY
jgi:hypothetical protein